MESASKLENTTTDTLPFSLESAVESTEQSQWESHVESHQSHGEWIETSQMESLKSQVQISEMARKDTLSSADAASDIYRVKIQGLNSIIVDLQNENLALKEDKTVLDSVDFSDNVLLDILRNGQAQTILNENAQLKQSLQEAHQELALMQSREPLGLPLVSSKEIPSAKHVLQEVERILKGGKPSDTIPLAPTTHIGTQTIEYSREEDDQIESLRALVDILQSQLKSKETIITCESEKNLLLQRTLDPLHKQLTELETQFEGLSKETEIVKAEERLSRETIQEQQETIARYSQQVLDLTTQIAVYKGHLDRLHEEHHHYKTAQSVLHHMSQVQVHHLQYSLNESESLRMDVMDHAILVNGDPENETERKTLGAAYEPVKVIESQWKADRKRLMLEMDLISTNLGSKELELERTRNEYEAKMSTMHNEQEWTVLLAKYTVVSDEAKQAQSELLTRASIIEMLQSQVNHMETLLDDFKRDHKTVKEKMLKYRDDSQRRESTNKQLTQKVSDLTQHVEMLDAKVKSLSQTCTNKDIYCRDLKSKLVIQASGKEKSYPDMEAVQETIKEFRQELLRKSALIKHWKTKASLLKQDISTLKEEQKQEVDPKILTSLQHHLRTTRKQSKEFEKMLDEAQSREVNLHRALYRIFESLYESTLSTEPSDSEWVDRDESTLMGLDPIEINKTAHLLAKSILHMDLDTILSSKAEPKPAQVSARLQEILTSSTMEQDLVSYYTHLSSEKRSPLIHPTLN